MNDKKVAWLLRTAIIIVGLFGLTVCAFWWPFSISLSTMGVDSSLSSLTDANSGVLVAVCILYGGIAALLCDIGNCLDCD